MNPIQSILDAKGVMILDGAMGTQLAQRGCDVTDELWSAKILHQQPDQIAQVHLDYFKAGADCVTTASYQATVEGFARRGFSEEEARALIARSVRLALEVRDTFWEDAANRENREKPLVAASLGPYGAYLADGSEYRGNYGIGADALAAFHRERMQLLVDAGAELLACETLPCLEEAEVLVDLIGRLDALYCWVSFSCKDGAHISDGTPIEDCVRAIAGHARVAAVGVNCTAPAYVEELVRRIAAVTQKPVLVYPNSGEEYDPVTKTWHGAADGLSYAQRAKLWHDAGARLLGGCCQTTPENIRQVAALFRN